MNVDSGDDDNDNDDGDSDNKEFTENDCWCSPVEVSVVMVCVEDATPASRRPGHHIVVAMSAIRRRSGVHQCLPSSGSGDRKNGGHAQL